MNIPDRTLKSGFSLPVYGLGTWQMGGRWEPDYSNDEAEIKAIRSALDHGITHIDTAEGYGDGHCEELVGQAIKGHDRSKLIITTKVAGYHQTYDGVLKSCAGSLKRLGLDYIDLYLLHSFPDPGINVADTMKAMDRLVEEGLVKNIGACNLSVNRFQAVQAATNNKVVCNQVHYSLHQRESEAKGVIKFCQDNDIFITAWGPLEKGSLEQAALLQEMADKYQKTPYQVALNWLISQPSVVTIPKTTNVEHLEENLGCLGWQLSDEDMAKLTKDFPHQAEVSERVPLDYPAAAKP